MTGETRLKSRGSRGRWFEFSHSMKLLLEILLSIILHPIAMLLMWINLLARTNIDGFKKFIWFVVSLIWGLGPIVYILVGDGTLW